MILALNNCPGGRLKEDRPWKEGGERTGILGGGAVRVETVWRAATSVVLRREKEHGILA